MIALLAVEVRRLLARRLVRLAGLLAALGIAVAGIAVAANADEFFTSGNLPGILAGTTVPLVLAAWVIGASSIGAEWHSGAMATTLTWEPRRFRLISAKLLAVVGLAFVFTVTFQALLTLALLPSTNDATAGLHYLVSPAGGRAWRPRGGSRWPWSGSSAVPSWPAWERPSGSPWHPSDGTPRRGSGSASPTW